MMTEKGIARAYGVFRWRDTSGPDGWYFWDEAIRTYQKEGSARNYVDREAQTIPARLELVIRSAEFVKERPTS